MRPIFRALFVSLALACGGDPSETTQAEEPLAPALLRYLRVDLAGNDAAPHIQRARLLNAPRATPSLGGALILVGYSSNGTVVTATPFSLPSELLLEGSKIAEATGESVTLQLVPLMESSVSLYLDASEDLDRVEVLSAAGDLLTSLSSDEFESSSRDPGARLLQAQEATSQVDILRNAFPQIDFLAPGDDLGLRFDLPPSPIEEIVPITETIAKDILEGLRRGPAKVLSSLRTLAVVRFATGGFDGLTYGSTVVLNEQLDTLQLDTVQTTVHEGTHTYQFLVDGGNDLALNRKPWPPEVISAAARTISVFNLDAGLTSAWQTLHEDAVENGLGGAFLGDDWQSLGQARAGDDAAAAIGFASSYGSSDAGEDQAEYVARLTVPENGYASPVCRLVREAGEPFPVARALPYIKIKFLEALELLTADQVTRCIGQPSIEGPPGIHFGNGLELTTDIKGGFIDLEGGHFLGVLATGAPYQMLIRVLASEEQPRGIYRLDDVFLTFEGATSAVLLGHDTELLRSRVSSRGMVLVSQYDPNRIAGAVFFLGLQGPLGTETDTFPMGTFRVDR